MFVIIVYFIYVYFAKDLFVFTVYLIKFILRVLYTGRRNLSRSKQLVEKSFKKICTEFVLDNYYKHIVIKSENFQDGTYYQKTF